MKNKIFISVSGSTGVGKTTVAMLISDLLSKHGFDVKLKDFDAQLEEKLDQTRINKVGEKTEVVISEIIIPREGVKHG